MILELEVDRYDNITVSRESFETILQAAYTDGRSSAEQEAEDDYGENKTRLLFRSIEDNERKKMLADMKKISDQMALSRKRLEKLQSELSRIYDEE